MFDYFSGDEPPKEVRMDNGFLVTIELKDDNGETFYRTHAPNFYHLVFCYEDEEWIR